MKRYLLIAGSRYYPSKGTGDWIECFETREEAENLVKDSLSDDYYDKFIVKGN